MHKVSQAAALACRRVLRAWQRAVREAAAGALAARMALTYCGFRLQRMVSGMGLFLCGIHMERGRFGTCVEKFLSLIAVKKADC